MYYYDLGVVYRMVTIHPCNDIKQPDFDSLKSGCLANGKETIVS